MAWLVRSKSEDKKNIRGYYWVSAHYPIRDNSSGQWLLPDDVPGRGNKMGRISDNAVEAIIGRPITWEDEPVQIGEIKEVKK